MASNDMPYDGQLGNSCYFALIGPRTLVSGYRYHPPIAAIRPVPRKMKPTLPPRLPASGLIYRTGRLAEYQIRYGRPEQTIYGIVNCIISPQAALVIVTRPWVVLRNRTVAISDASTNPTAPIDSW